MGVSAEPSPDGEMLRTYWHTQWERVAKLEENRLQVSNFVVAASIVALGLALATNGRSGWTLAIICVAVVLANLCAAWHCDRTERAVRMHKARSDELLREHWPYLLELKHRVGEEEPSRLDRLLGHPRPGYTAALQLWIHLIVVAASVGLGAVVWLA